MTDLPLEKHLKKLDKLGRMLKWGVELGEFDFQYTPRTSLKGQALVDFIVECTIMPTEEDMTSLQHKEDKRL